MTIETTKTITLYGKDPCPLCDEMEQFLTHYALPYTYIDITSDEALIKRFGWFIPVLEIFTANNKEPTRLLAPHNYKTLLETLKS